jgi:hypothetical protein
MKRILITVIVVACLAFVMVGPAQAASSFMGSTFMSYGTYASIIVTTSNNVYMLYNGDSTSGQSYGAFTKNGAGDKYYATGGGQGSSSGLYFQQSDKYVGDTKFSGMTSTLFETASGWTAQ